MRIFLSALIALTSVFGCSREDSIRVPDPLPHSQDAQPSEQNANKNPESTKDETSLPGSKSIEGTQSPGNGSTAGESQPNPNQDDTNGTKEPNTPQIPPMDKNFFSEPHEVLGELAAIYQSDLGLWPDGWRSSAVAIMALTDYMQRTKTEDFFWILDNTFRKNHFLKESYEDNALWGIAWLGAYELTKDERYLSLAKTIHDQLNSASWSSSCNGGLNERSDRASKSASANLLFIQLSAGLFTFSSNDIVYRDNAVKTWKWFIQSPLVTVQKQIETRLSTGTCEVKAGARWSMNQGLILGALKSLYKATRDESYLAIAKDFLAVGLKEFTSDQIITETYLKDCRLCMDGETFYKGLYAQNLTSISKLILENETAKILEKSAMAAWMVARGGGSGGIIGYNWRGVFDSASGGRQAAAVFLFNSQLSKNFSQDFARGAEAKSSSQCNLSEAGKFAFDGHANTKWCGMMGNNINHLTVDMEKIRIVRSIRILHAGSGGEDRTLNTKDFELQISMNGQDFFSLGTYRGNESSMTLHKVEGLGRYIRVRFMNPGADNIGRIYEMNVY